MLSEAASINSASVIFEVIRHVVPVFKNVYEEFEAALNNLSEQWST